MTKIYTATWLEEDSQGDVLTEAQYPFRLLSYFFLQNETDERLLEYFANGTNKEHPRSTRDAKKAK